MLYNEFKPSDREYFKTSRYGYVIEPDGTILALNELQVHGQIAYDRNPEVVAYYDALDEDRKSRTKMAAELYATNDLGHIRVSIAPYIYQWSIGTSWNVLATSEQKVAMQFLFDVCGQRDAEVWGNAGPMDGEDFLRTL
jgi:hypothetical protein